MSADETRRPSLAPDGLSRRAVLLAGGMATAAALAPSMGSGSAVASARAVGVPGATCLTLTPEQIEGPYYLDAGLLRTDITGGKAGVPLDLRLRVVDVQSCAPVRGAAVDIWHCDALGVYSGYIRDGNGVGDRPQSTDVAPVSGPVDPAAEIPHEQPTDHETFLRGTQLTDRDGFVRFRTIIPGWYDGRAVHIHTKVRIGEIADRKRSVARGGHCCHTGQLYIADDVVRALAKIAPYNTDRAEPTLLAQDSYFPHGGSAGLLRLGFVPKHTRSVVESSMTMGIDPSRKR
ncbi:intradiol ring-cleavage dioxygenase [Catenulispora yoronensis]|uniref:intradiol ring-cleavage dioxygenase n=1 Tax=Catenulispora yoronensis TaxID=450799 RepID=UPI0031DF0B16